MKLADIPVNCAGRQHLERGECQRRFYEEECDPEFEIARPHNCARMYQFLIEHRFQTALRMLAMDLNECSVLEVCCGSGMMAEKFARCGARVTAIDFSPAAIGRAQERARRYAFAARFMVADATELPFADRSFDVAAVHDGLHHLDDPYRAIEEMARVSRRGVMIMDPAQAALTRLAIRLGFAKEVEEAGNRVERLAPGKVAARLYQGGFRRVAWRRALMYYPHVPRGWWRWFDRAPLFLAFRFCFLLVDFAIGRWGNKLALAATR
jgi:SAM-dependent methyltransferase